LSRTTESVRAHGRQTSFTRIGEIRANTIAGISRTTDVHLRRRFANRRQTLQLSRRLQFDSGAQRLTFKLFPQIYNNISLSSIVKCTE